MTTVAETSSLKRLLEEKALEHEENLRLLADKDAEVQRLRNDVANAVVQLVTPEQITIEGMNLLDHSLIEQSSLSIEARSAWEADLEWRIYDVRHEQVLWAKNVVSTVWLAVERERFTDPWRPAQ